MTRRIDVADLPRIAKCDRCRRRMRSADGWNLTAMGGVVVGFLCPDCQTPQENAEAEIHEATLDYIAGPDGRIGSRPKATSA